KMTPLKCTYLTLFSPVALSAVQMKTVDINGRVGETVTIRCLFWPYITGNVKYFCSSPCTEDKHVIIKAGYEKINRKDRIKLFNNGEVLSVTFTDLQKSDAGKYYCGVEIVGIDAYIKVNKVPYFVLYMQRIYNFIYLYSLQSHL
uniref:Immunoglobulin domain-containing protein n=1 Tax=Labrus bergylta TaxID=56723 RepID=A0A3Q3FBX7_9LABR